MVEISALYYISKCAQSLWRNLILAIIFSITAQSDFPKALWQGVFYLIFSVLQGVMILLCHVGCIIYFFWLPFLSITSLIFMASNLCNQSPSTKSSCRKKTLDNGHWRDNGVFTASLEFSFSIILAARNFLLILKSENPLMRMATYRIKI